MQCPRCGATAPDTTSRCGRCDSPLQAATTGNAPAAAPAYDGPPPIQQAPLGAPIYEGGGGPPVQAFVESADDAWHPLGHQFPPSAPPSAAPQVTPSTPPALPVQPAGNIGESPGESTQMWTPPPEFADPPASSGAAPSPRHAAPEQTVPQPPPMGSPPMGSPPMGAPRLGAPPPPASASMGESMDALSFGQSSFGQSSLGQSSLGQSSMGPPQTPSYDMPQESVPQDAVAERTMAVWLSDSPPAPAAPSAHPSAGRDAPYQTPVYGTSVPPQNGNGQGRNETAIMHEPPPAQQPGGWQQEGWQPEPWQQQGPGGYDSGPGGGPGGPPPQRQSGGASKPLVFTVIGLVAVALVAAVVVLWPDGGDKSPASASPSQAAADSPAATPKINSVAHREALAVNKVLNASAASRGGLARAIAAAGSCKGLPTAITGFERVATERQSQMAHTRALRVGRLANGARLRQTLGRSIQYSLAADQALLTWARGRQGCHGKPKPDANFKRAGGSLSAQASAAKSQFAALWAPVAKQHHLPVRTANSF